MKTKTTHPTKIGENTNTRNFFQKIFILLAILAFTSFGFKAKAQNFTVAVDLQNTNCTTGWSIDVYDNSPTPVLLFTVSPISTGLNTYGCYPYSGSIGFIKVLRSGCTTLTFGNLGSFPYTSSSPSCCSATVTCAGGGGNGFCTPPLGLGDVHLLVQIL